MDLKELTPDLCVSPQITPEEVKDLADQGFRSIVCHRPDGEADGQPSFQDIEAAADQLGLACRYQPIEPGGVTGAAADTFAGLLETLPMPVIAYCRTGNRSSSLWSLSQTSPDQ